VTEVAVCLLNVPTPEDGETDQVTPLPLESLERTIFRFWPALTNALVGESAIVTGTPTGVGVLLLFPQPTRNPRVPTKTNTKKLRTLSSLL
jgi:hypothetical protein